MVDDREAYRKEVDSLIASQNRDLVASLNRGLAMCPSDGKRCLTPERQIVWFGVMASDGKEEIECFCPRFKPKGRG